MRDKKLAEDWFKANDWTSDYDEARKRSKETGKVIFSYFTRSNTDRAPGAILEGAFSAPEFKTFSNGVVLFMHLTTGIEGDKHANLPSEKGGSIPYLAILDSNGDITARPKGQDVADFRAGLEASKTFLDLKGRQESLSPADAFTLLVQELDFGRVEVAEAEKRHKALSALSKEQDEKLSALIAKKKAFAADKKIMELVRKNNPKNDAEAAAVGKAYYAMYQEGVRPTGPQPFEIFYILLSKHAKAEKNPAIFEIALGALKEKFGSNPRASRFLEQKQEELDELKLEAGQGK
jgi:hypothetical protein